MAHESPDLQAVLAHVVRDRVVYIALTREQKKALRDEEGQLALDVVRHLLGAREAAFEEPPEKFPLVAFAFQAVARKLGHEIGIKRCGRMIRRLRSFGAIRSAGSYRQEYRNAEERSGFRVALYRVARHLASALSTAPLQVQRTVGRLRLVKRESRTFPRRRWYQHPLFGDYEGRPPPHLTPEVAKRMRSLDEVPGEAARVASVTAP